MSPRLFRPFAAAVVLAGFAAAAPRASAEFVTLQYTGSAGNPVVSNNLLDAQAGPFYWTENGFPENTAFPPPTSTFCIELNTGPPIQTLPAVGENVKFDVVSVATAPSIMSATKADLISELYGKYYDTAWDSPTFKAAAKGLDPSLSFQLALWELVYDGKSNNLGTGTFAIPNTGLTAATTAQTWLNSLTATGDASYFTNRFVGKELVALIAPSTVPAKGPNEIQDQITIRPVGAVPAPPALILAGIGIVGLIGRSRFRRPTA